MKSQNHTVAKYTVAIEVAKPPDVVFNHLINDVSKFWPEEFEGESTKLNDQFVFRSGSGQQGWDMVIKDRLFNFVTLGTTI